MLAGQMLQNLDFLFILLYYHATMQAWYVYTHNRMQDIFTL